MKVILSKTRDQLNKFITFHIKIDETTVEGVGCDFNYSMKESINALELHSINDMEISITNQSINYQDRIIINGIFDELNFIGFYSELPASWIVQKSNFYRKVLVFEPQ